MRPRPTCGTSEFRGAEPPCANALDFTPAYVESEATYLVPPGSPLQTIAEVDCPDIRRPLARQQADPQASDICVLLLRTSKPSFYIRMGQQEVRYAVDRYATHPGYRQPVGARG